MKKRGVGWRKRGRVNRGVEPSSHREKEKSTRDMRILTAEPCSVLSPKDGNSFTDRKSLWMNSAAYELRITNKTSERGEEKRGEEGVERRRGCSCMDDSVALRFYVPQVGLSAGRTKKNTINTSA